MRFTTLIGSILLHSPIIKQRNGLMLICVKVRLI